MSASLLVFLFQILHAHYSEMRAEFFHAGDALARGPDVAALAAKIAPSARETIVRTEGDGTATFDVRRVASCIRFSQHHPADGAMANVEGEVKRRCI